MFTGGVDSQVLGANRPIKPAAGTPAVPNNAKLADGTLTVPDDAKLADGTLTVPNNEHASFCFEIMMHMLYCSCSVYDYRRVIQPDACLSLGSLRMCSTDLLCAHVYVSVATSC